PIYLFAVDNETQQWTYETTINADGNGEFVVDPYFIVELRHLGVQFHVTAVGQSTMQADVYFTDAGSLGYSPSTQSLSAIAGGPTVSFTQTITSPNQSNIPFTVTVQLNTQGGGNHMQSSWISTSPASLSFSGAANESHSWTVFITVPSGAPTGA